MQHRPLRLVALVILALGLAVPLGACGGKGSSDGGADGAASPEDFVARGKKISETEDLSLIVPLVLPEQRAVLTMMLGIFPNTMMLGMAEAFSGMGGGGGDDAAKEKIASWKKEWEALLAEHKIELPEEGKGPNLMAMNKAKTEEEKRAFIAQFEDLLGHVDHQTFIRESVALMNKHADKKSKSATEGVKKKFDMTNVKIKVEGEQATLEAPGEKKPLVIVKRDGRWYIDMAKSM